MEQFSESDICALTEDLWLSMLNLPTTPAFDGQLPESTGHTIIGIVNVSGDWSGAILLHLPYALAARVATTMLNLGETPPTLLDLQDSVGEMTNMTAGGIKALLPGVSQLSLPTVVEGSGFSIRFPAMETVGRIAFHQEDCQFVVTIAAAAAPTAH